MDEDVVIGGRLVRASVADGRIAALEPLGDSGSDQRAGLPRWTSGFVDIHCHGAAGFGFESADEAGIRAALAEHFAHGTRLAALSLVSAPVPELTARIAALVPVVAGWPHVLGVHLEGPFLSPKRRGAHDEAVLCTPTAEAVDQLLEAGDGTLIAVTMAPELPGAIDAIQRFVDAGVIVAVGHTEASFDEAAAAFDAGASLLTHAYNGMPPFAHRAPGPIGAALSRDHVTLELIADGVHVHQVVIAALMAAAPGRVALISDAMAATGLGDGAYRLGSLDVEVRDGTPMLAGSESIAGSTLTLDRAIDVCVGAGVDIDVAIAAASKVPAKVFGVTLPEIGVGTSLKDIVAVESPRTSLHGAKPSTVR